MGALQICFYGWREGAGHRFLNPNNATDLWHVKKILPQKMVHLTEKPVELAVRAIQYSSRPGESVLDLFGGSGSTLIACEQTGRRAFLMEIDALYCDVTVQRREQFTGRKAVRQQSAPVPDTDGDGTQGRWLPQGVRSSIVVSGTASSVGRRYSGSSGLSARNRSS